jgi:hypothetical protein
VSATRHGLFRSRFMFCDRCVSNASCAHFKPGGECFFEEKMFRETVKELTEEYDLDGSAHRILVDRAAMYLIRTMRAEAYEAAVGAGEESKNLEAHIAKMDSVLRGLFKDLAISRGKRMQLKKGESLLVSLDDALRKFARLEKENAHPAKKNIKMRKASSSPRVELWAMWEKDYPELRSMLKEQKKVDKEEKER